MDDELDESLGDKGKTIVRIVVCALTAVFFATDKGVEEARELVIEAGFSEAIANAVVKQMVKRRPL